MKITKEQKVHKSLRDLKFALSIMEKDYVNHFTEPTMEQINKSFNFIEDELIKMIKRNFGKEKIKHNDQE